MFFFVGVVGGFVLILGFGVFLFDICFRLEWVSWFVGVFCLGRGSSCVLGSVRESGEVGR